MIIAAARSDRPALCQLLEQGLGVLQIGGIEALGEPAIDGREQFMRLGPPALFAPQPSEARRGAQLIGCCLLPARDTQRLFEGGLRLFDPVETDERNAFEPVKLRLPAALPRLFLVLQPLSYHSERLVVLTRPRERFSQPGQAVMMQSNCAGLG